MKTKYLFFNEEGQELGASWAEEEGESLDAGVTIDAAIPGVKERWEVVEVGVPIPDIEKGVATQSVVVRELL